MPKWFVAVGGLFAVLGAVFAAMLLSSFFPASGTVCSGYPVMAVASRSGTSRAEVQNDTCDPDDEVRTVVYLSRAEPSKSRPEKWSAFIASSVRIVGPGVYSPLQLQLRWLSETELEIAYPAGTQLRSRAGVANGITVSYREQNVP